MRLDSPRFFGSNAGRSRQWNRAMVLRQVRAAGRAGRAQIARATGLSTQAVSNIIAELTAEGLLCQQGARRAGRGLPVAQYGVAARGGYALGVDLRPGKLRAALSDLAGTSCWQGEQALASGQPQEVAAAIAGLRAQALAEGPGPQARLLGVGVVMPGPFGAAGVADPETELPGWRDLSPDPWLEVELGLPVLVENDANAAAVSEHLSGRARGVEDFAFLYFGSGLGLGVMAEGRLLRGAQGNAGEIGHVRLGGVRLEEVASRAALARRLSAAGLPARNLADLAAALTHPATLDWLEVAAAALSEAVLMVENLFDPQTILLGGALPEELIDALIARITLSPASLANRPGRLLPRLLRGACGRSAATRGAAALVVDRLFTPRLEDV